MLKFLQKKPTFADLPETFPFLLIGSLALNEWADERIIGKGIH